MLNGYPPEYAYNIPIKGLADAHDVTIIGTKEVEGIVGFLDNQKLAGHFGKVEIVADMGFLYFAEGYGYGEVFYHDTVIWCKDRIFRRKKSLARRIFGQGSLFTGFYAYQL